MKNVVSHLASTTENLKAQLNQALIKSLNEAMIIVNAKVDKIEQRMDHLESTTAKNLKVLFNEAMSKFQQEAQTSAISYANAGRQKLLVSLNHAQDERTEGIRTETIQLVKSASLVMQQNAKNKWHDYDE